MSLKEFHVGDYEIKIAPRPLVLTAGTVLLAAGAASGASCAFTGIAAREVWAIVAVLVAAAAYACWRLLGRHGIGTSGEAVIVEISRDGSDAP